MTAILLQTGQGGDLFSLILSMLIIAIPFLYIMRMSSAARRRQQAPPRSHPHSDDDLEVADKDEPRPAEADSSEEPSKRRRVFARAHPYEEIQAERKSPQQRLREALQRTQPHAPQHADTEAAPAAQAGARRRQPAPSPDRSAGEPERLHGSAAAISEGGPAERRKRGLERVKRLPQLQQAVLWSEILGSPKGIPGSDRTRGDE